jgi:predicted nucleic acid-binding Zn ribbon protein
VSDKICVICGADLPKHKQNFCSIQCRKSTLPTKQKKHCLYCNDLFIPYHNHHVQKFCSEGCRISSRKKPFEKKSCNQCGVIFQPNGACAKFCSIECRDIAYLPRKQEHKTKRKLEQYGLQLDEYESLMIQQNNHCAICNQPEKNMLNGKLRRLAIDHCHISGVVRGLLCFQCNVGLSNFNDNWVLLENAIEYLVAGDLKAGTNQRMGNRNVNA